MPMPRKNPVPNGPACGRRVTNRTASTGNTGSSRASDPIDANAVSPSASPPSPASASPEPGDPQPAPGAALGARVATAHHERVDKQAEAAEQQHLDQRLGHR